MSLFSEELDASVYDEVRRIALRYVRLGEKGGNTLSPTDVAHEVLLRLRRVDPMKIKVMAARAVRQVLIDRGRRRSAMRRGGDVLRVVMDDLDELPQRESTCFELEEALQSLAELDERAARLVELRFFGGMTHGEVARELGVSVRTVEEDWRAARAFLLAQLRR